MNPGRSISGRVVDETGAPVAKATVAAGMLLTGGGAELYIKDESIGAKDTETDADGRFVLDGFPPSTLTVIAGKANAGRSASLQHPAGPDSATLELRLGRTTKLTGKVTRGGAPVAVTVVIANPIGAVASNFFVTTGPDGAFTLDALAPGAYIVYPMLGEGGRGPKDMYTRRVDLALGASPNQRQNVNLEVKELARLLDVEDDQVSDLLSAYIVAEDLALRQVQQEEDRPLLRHVQLGSMHFDAVLIEEDTITCIEVSFLVVPDVRQDKIESMLKKISTAKKNLATAKLRLRLRLMVVLVTQLSKEEEEHLRGMLITRRFTETPVDIDIRLLDFESLQKVYVTD